MLPVFLDTSYILALNLSNDQHHTQARQHWQTLTLALPLFVTTSYVFDEAITFFKSRDRHTKALEIGTQLLTSPSVQLVQVERDLFQEGWEYLKQRPDKTYSLTDCISFKVMEQMKIITALTFDHHFTQAGFDTQPR
ncbi:type II toxin-antitoxin system VapC family toxin [Leptolyngbyaceae cyanobacterium UHCC 1019]